MSAALPVYFDSPLAPEMAWVWGLFARDACLAWRPCADRAEAEAAGGLVLGEDDAAGLRLSSDFRLALQQRRLSAESLMPREPLLRLADGTEDWLSTAFYLINSLQEYGHDAADRYGRFPFSASLQARLGVAERNLVGEYFRALHARLGERFRLEPWPDRPSAVWLSHDIDLVYRGWREDGRYALSRGRADQFLGMVLRQLSGRPHWLNIGELIAEDRAAGAGAVFFWIPRKGRRGEAPPDADYHLSDGPVRRALELVAESPGCALGLHASAHGQLDEGLAAFSYPLQINRHHFLRIRLPEHYQRVEQAGLVADASLGFAEHPGFRNSYGMPFQPWCLEERRVYRFTEFPLHLMDTTFHHYLPLAAGIPDKAETRADMARQRGLDFLDAHRRDCVLSVLWHNNYATTYAYGAFAPVYRSWLQGCRELGLEWLGLEGLLGRFGPR